MLRTLAGRSVSLEVLGTLSEHGYRTVLDFVTEDPEKLSQNTGISYKELVALRHVIIAQYSTPPVDGAALYDDIISTVAILSTGCACLDTLLDGGLYSSEVTELTGPAAAGKSQICLSASISVAVNHKQNVLFIDTSGGLDLGRLQELLQYQVNTQEEAESACSRIKCVPCHSVQELLNILQHTREQLSKQTDGFYQNLKLLVVDSITPVISPIFGGQHQEGHGLMMHMARTLQVLCSEYSLAGLVTNNTVTSADQHVKPALGRTWAGVPNVRLMVTRPGTTIDGSRVASLVKSSRQSTDVKATFFINESGLTQ